MSIEEEPAFVLHTRPYRETSMLVDVFSRHYGRFRCVAKGIKGGKSAKKSTKSLNPYTPYLIAWSGKTELKILKNFELSGTPIFLSGNSLYCGFYLNELLLRVLTEHDPHEHLFDSYLNVLIQLSNGKAIEPSLRAFEFTLLEEVGYALILDTEASSGSSICSDYWYQFDPTIGFTQIEEGTSNQFTPGESKKYIFCGSELLAIAKGEYQDPTVAKAAKRLIRLALQPHLGSTPLRSRALFRNE